MGEYAGYKGQSIKIGTCEDMYYLRFDQRHMVTPERGNVHPVDDAAELRFRFPFPDEDSNQPGDFNDYHRGITVHGFPSSPDVEHYSLQFRHDAGYLVSLPCPESNAYTDDSQGARVFTTPTPLSTSIRVHRNGFKGAVQLVAQKWRPGIGLVPILRCACGAMWRTEDREDIELLAVCLRSEGDRNSGSGKTFYHTIADRVLGGLLQKGHDADVHAS